VDGPVCFKTDQDGQVRVMRLKRFPILLISLIMTIPLSAKDSKLHLKTPSGTIELIRFSTYYYCSFDLNKPSTFTLSPDIKISHFEISPLSRHIPFSFNGKEVSFTLNGPGHYVVRLNDTIKIFLFAERNISLKDMDLIDIVEKYKADHSGITNQTQVIQKALNDISGSGKVLFFPPGNYKTSQLRIYSNSKIYFSRGAVLEADTVSVKPYFTTDNIENKRFIYMNGAENVEITGQGTINGNGNILRARFGDDARMRLFLAVNSKNIIIDGLTFKNPGSWNTQVIHCNTINFRNVKLLNDTELSNTDGFDPDASEHVLIENCFACCGDDNVAVKCTGKSDPAGYVNDVKVKGCVFLTRKSSLKVGTETRAGIMKNIIFENNDVLEADRGMALYIYDGAILDSIFYINNRFERNYPDAQRKGIHFEVKKRTPDSKTGSIRNVVIKDCIFNEAFPRRSVITCEGDTADLNVTIENLVVNCKKAGSLQIAGIDTINSTVVFK
jgi:polygalacturonase